MVKIENSRRREVHHAICEPDLIPPADFLNHRVGAWIRSVLMAAAESGVCKSFIVSVHVDGCDHEVLR
jgi:hypothetical protein